MGRNQLCYIILVLIALLFSIQSSAVSPSSIPAPSSSICKSTQFPQFCTQVLPSNSSFNVYDYSRFSIKKSLSAAKDFLSLIKKQLQQSKNLTISALRALEDCKFLAETNIDYLTSCSQTVNNNPQTVLNTIDADDGQTLLSAVLTNIDTCIDGLQDTASAWSIRDGILTPLSNDTKLYSISLALFTEGWVPKRKKNAPLEITIGRRLLQVMNGTNPVLISGQVTVRQDGTGNYTNITDAVNAAPTNSNGSKGYFLIYVTAGIYEEYVTIATNKKYLMMVGDGINQTIITGNHSVIDGWTTFTSGTFTVTGTAFVGVNMTIRNTAGAIKHQAVAVRNGADLSTFYNCSFEGYQDTLYVHSLRQFYRECDIYGTVDFIFGNAAVVFQNCNMYPRLPMSNQFNAITAQGRTDPNQNTGISTHNCTIRAAEDLANSNLTIRTYLGRPWKEYSRAVYMQTFMDSLINPAGWSIWSGDFALNTSYYAEFNNTGPGSNTSQRVTWPGFHIINETDAVNFTVSGFLLGDSWIPKTGVLYTSGLV